MKKTFNVLLFACALALGAVGCKEETNIDTAKLQSAFSGAPAEIKEQVDKAVAAINSSDYRTAIGLLDAVIAKSNELGQVQLDAAGEAFVLANVIVQERGAAMSAAEAKAKAGEIEAQSKGSQ